MKKKDEHQNNFASKGFTSIYLHVNIYHREHLMSPRTGKTNRLKHISDD